MKDEKDMIPEMKEKMETEPNFSLKRRTWLKAMLGIPVLGIFSYEVFSKWNFDQHKKNRVLELLGLENLNSPLAVKTGSDKPGDLLRIGIIGFGTRHNNLLMHWDLCILLM
jgi:hypothetical protein